MKNNLPIPAIPIGSAAITPEWLTSALLASQAFVSAEVLACNFELFDIDGFMGETVRVRMKFADPNGGHPPTLILKLPSPDAEFSKVLAQNHIYEREVRFYQELADQTEIRSPTCYYSGISESGEQFVLLLEDLAPMCLSDQIKGCTQLEAELAIEALAKLHAPFWNNQMLDDVSWVSETHSPHWMNQEAYVQTQWPKCVENIGDILGDAFRAIGHSYGAAIPQLACKMSRLPQTLIHGDFRLDNLLFNSSNSKNEVAVIDWQTMKKGCGLCDVAYFISINLTSDLRREIEQSLLDLYHATLIQCGVTDYSIDQCRNDFRLSLIYPLNTLTYAVSIFDRSSGRKFELVKSIFSRLTATLQDHDVLELIESSVSGSNHPT